MEQRIGHRQDRELSKPASLKASRSLPLEKMLIVMTVVRVMGIAMPVLRHVSRLSVPGQVEQAYELPYLPQTAPTDLRQQRVSQPQSRRHYYTRPMTAHWPDQARGQQQKAAPITWIIFNPVHRIRAQQQQSMIATAITAVTHIHTRNLTIIKTRTKILPIITIITSLKMPSFPLDFKLQ